MKTGGKAKQTEDIGVAPGSRLTRNLKVKAQHDHGGGLLTETLGT